ncbi:MAG: hypothetical protein PHE02_07975 [Lachnospiraceae bacterium]|nr:hypothetical protein [Lachnospiraceae bacterium]
MAKETEVSCKNVFKNNDKVALTQAFNQKWLELINQFERAKTQPRAAK